MLPAIGDRPAAQALSDALERIAGRYGQGTVDMVAMQLELPASCSRQPCGVGAEVSAR
jgi:hypothetical protein